MTAVPTVVHIITSLEKGPAQTLLASVLEQLREGPIKHHVIFFHDGPVRQQIERSGVETHKVSGYRSLYEPFFFSALFQRVKMLEPSMIHTSLWSADLFGRMIGRQLKVPVVSSIHGLVEHYGWMKNFIEVLLPVMQARFIAVSPSVKRSLMRKWNIPIEKIAVLPTAIDAEGVMRSGRKAASFLKGRDEFVIGTVTRLLSGKNIEFLMEAYAQVFPYFPKTRLLIVGDGPQEDVLRAQARSMTGRGVPEDRIVIISGEDAYAYYPLFDCFVQPSQSDDPKALLEALGNGLPSIIVSETRRHDFILHEKTGLIVGPGSAELLARELHRVLADEELRARLAKAGRKAATITFSMKETAAVYDEVFREVIGLPNA